MTNPSTLSLSNELCQGDTIEKKEKEKFVWPTLPLLFDQKKFVRRSFVFLCERYRGKKVIST